MSYGRDPDRNTRGAGAIASRDNAHPSAALARRAGRNRRTVARDRVMRTMTYGPKGGMSPLGALNLGYQGGASSPWTGGVRGGTGLTFEGGQTNVPQVPTAPSGGSPTVTSPKVTAAVINAMTAMNKAPTLAARYPTTSSPSFPVATTDPGTSAPTVPVPSKTTTKPPVKGVTVSGGGGVWTPPRPTGTPLPGFEATDLPDVPAGSAKPSFDIKTAAIVGAAALGAFLLLRKKKGQP